LSSDSSAYFDILNITENDQGTCGVPALQVPFGYTATTGYGEAVIAWLSHVGNQRNTTFIQTDSSSSATSSRPQAATTSASGAEAVVKNSYGFIFALIMLAIWVS
jgi:hypothetical protein